MGAPKYLTTRDLADMTGFSTGFFAQRARSGDLPAKRFGAGPRALYMIEETEFNKWWENRLREVEPCQHQQGDRSKRGVKSGTRGSSTKAKSTLSRSKQHLKQWRENASQNMSKN